MRMTNLNRRKTRSLGVSLDVAIHKKVEALSISTARSMASYWRGMLTSTVPYLAKAYKGKGKVTITDDERGYDRKNICVQVPEHVWAELKALKADTGTPMTTFISIIYLDTVDYMVELYGKDTMRHSKNVMQARIAKKRHLRRGANV